MTQAKQIRDIGRHDSLRRLRHRRMFVRALMWMALLVLVIGTTGWILFWSPLMRINRIDTSGVPTDQVAGITALVQSSLNRQWFHWIPIGRTALFVHAPILSAQISAAFAELQDVEVQLHLPHEIVVTAQNRQPLGTWCRGDVCQFWDATGARWGTAVASTGPLLLLVHDQRVDDNDPKLLPGLLAVVHGLAPLGLGAREVTLPNDEPGGIRITTIAGYDVLLDAEGDVGDQLDTISVFLAQQSKDPTFHPHYIDVRTSGRVYWK
jgi:cell division septal protein FtsQ